MENSASELLVLGLLMETGLVAGLLASCFGMPRIAAYVAAGAALLPRYPRRPHGY
jgi:Kef-type K+ transport system membrane component KefB